MSYQGKGKDLGDYTFQEDNELGSGSFGRVF